MAWISLVMVWLVFSLAYGWIGAFALSRFPVIEPEIWDRIYFSPTLPRYARPLVSFCWLVESGIYQTVRPLSGNWRQDCQSLFMFYVILNFWPALFFAQLLTNPLTQYFRGKIAKPVPPQFWPIINRILT